MKKLSHFDRSGNPKMVDIGKKEATERTAEARCIVEIGETVSSAITKGEMKKGNPLITAEIAGIMAAKKTHELIPLCHPIPIDHISVHCEVKKNYVEIIATIKSTSKTGVEMEALTAVAVAGLTVIDMCKSITKGISIKEIKLLKKTGGKSGTYIAE